MDLEELDRQYLNAPIEDEEGVISPPIILNSIESLSDLPTFTLLWNSATGAISVAPDVPQITYPVTTQNEISIPIPETVEETYDKDFTHVEDYDELFKEVRSRIEKLFTAHYGEKFVSFNGNDEVIVHYPRLEVTNSSSESCVITDLYVIYELSISQYDKVIDINIGSVKGTRTTFTQEEFTSGYNFSHLSGDPEGIGYFCFGEGPISDVVDSLNFDDSSEEEDWDEDTFIGRIFNESNLETYIDTLESLLFLMDEYLTWESMETSPYKYMSSIGGINRFTDTSNAPSTFSSSALEVNATALLHIIIWNKEYRERLIDECFISTDKEFTLDAYKTAMFLNDLLTSSYSNYILSKFEYDPTSFTMKGGTKKISTEPIGKDGIITVTEGDITFKGEILKRYVVNYIKKDDDGDKITIINPAFVAAFIQQLIKLFSNINHNIDEIIPTKGIS